MSIRLNASTKSAAPRYRRSSSQSNFHAVRGTSENEIRKTYEHWIKEAEDRLDEVQRQAWLAQGLDENGSQRKQQFQ
jgi:hypothetical protein